MQSLNIKDHPGENVADYCDTILADDDFFESAGSFNPDQIGYIFCIFEDTSDPTFHVWAIQKYKEVMDFIKNFCVCDKDVMKTDEINTYSSLVQDAKCEYGKIIDSKQWEPTYSKKKSQYELLFMKSPTVEIEDTANKTAEKVNFKKLPQL